MKQLVKELIITLTAFFVAWYGLSRIDWLKRLNIESQKDQTTEQLGEYLWNRVKTSNEVIYKDEVVQKVDTLVEHLCEKNAFSCENIKLHIINKDQVNAFAMPDGHLVVFSGLIKYCDHEAALCGVLGHELAHIREKHVMQKLVKEMGLALLVTATSGNSGGNTLSRVLRVLSSSAYDRDLEQAADKKAVDYLANAGINPQPFADFLFRLGNDDQNALKAWISTHPQPKKRAKNVLGYAGEAKKTSGPILGAEQWEVLQEAIENRHSGSLPD